MIEKGFDCFFGDNFAEGWRNKKELFKVKHSRGIVGII